MFFPTLCMPRLNFLLCKLFNSAVIVVGNGGSRRISLIWAEVRLEFFMDLLFFFFPFKKLLNWWILFQVVVKMKCWRFCSCLKLRKHGFIFFNRDLKNGVLSESGKVTVKVEAAWQLYVFVFRRQHPEHTLFWDVRDKDRTDESVRFSSLVFLPVSPCSYTGKLHSYSVRIVQKNC